MPTAVLEDFAGFACFPNVLRGFAITVYVVFFAHGRSRQGRLGLANAFVLQGFSTDSGPRHGFVPFRATRRERGVFLVLLFSMGLAGFVITVYVVFLPTPETLILLRIFNDFSRNEGPKA